MMKDVNPYRDILKEKKPLTSAQEALESSFLSLLENKPAAEISVTELCKKASVARTTFYALYPNSDALLEEIEDGLIHDFLLIPMPKDADPDVYLRETVKFVESHRSMLFIMTLKWPNRRLAKKWREAIKYQFYDRFEGENSELALELFSFMALGSYVWYLENPSSFSIDSLMELFRSSLKILL